MCSGSRPLIPCHAYQFSRRGIQSVIVLMAYYGVPLTSMVEVVKTRNAASIYAPLAIGAIANGTMW